MTTTILAPCDYIRVAQGTMGEITDDMVAEFNVKYGDRLTQKERGRSGPVDREAGVMACVARVVLQPDQPVQTALNVLKRQLVREGDWRLVQYRSPDSRRTGHVGPAERRRIKSLRARKRQRRAAQRGRAHTAMLDRLGLDDRPMRRKAA